MIELARSQFDEQGELVPPQRHRVPATATSAQLAVADWLSSLYLAGLEDW